MVKPDPIAAELKNLSVVVVDASLAIDAILGTPTRQAVAVRFLAACASLGVRLIAPPTFPSEADTAARQAVLRGNIQASALQGVYTALDALPVEMALDKTELDSVRLRARAIAEKLTQPSVYDSTYTALAEARGTQFWTADAKFVRAAHSPVKGKPGAHQQAGVYHVGDY